MSDRVETAATSPPRADVPTTVYVCVTCREGGQVPIEGEACAGARLYANVAAAALRSSIRVVPVECLSVCKRVCTVSFAAPGKWTYVYGDLPAETAADTILAGAHLYAEARDGIIPWRERPEALKKGVIARIPPLGSPS